MNVGIIFGQMLVLFAMMMIGYFIYKKDWVTEDASKMLSKLVVNICNPILIINGVLSQDSIADMDSIFKNLKLIILYFTVLVLFGYFLLFILRPKEKTRSIYRLMTIFSNVGFMGIPVIKSVYGNGAMIYVAFYILVYNMLLYTYGLHLSKKAAEEFSGKIPAAVSFGESMKRMVNPGVIASVMAVAIFVTGIGLPAPVHTFCDYMGNMTIPLSMLLIGVSIAQEDLKQMFGDIRMYVFILIRMLLLPIAMIFLLRGFYGNDIVFGVFILEMSMPVGSVITLFAKESGADSAYCTKGIVLTTLASIITIPVIGVFL